MLESMFVDRKDELEFLESKHESEGFECILVYGRRRIGKTELLKEFISDKNHVYHLATQKEEEIQLEKLVNSVHKKFGGTGPKIESWEEFFDYYAENSGEGTILVIDEFCYLVEENSAIPSLFQTFIDEYLQEKNMLLILCGSSISMMERLMSYGNPLYGRRTGQIDLPPFGFNEARELLGEKDLQEQIEFYSVFGGTPFYLQKIDQGESLVDNIQNNICRETELLHEEPLMLLREEFRRPNRYMTILETIAAGHTKPKEIADNSKVPLQSISKYLGELERIRLIEHEIPVTERRKRSRKGLYKISDNFLDFWFRFIGPNMSDVRGDPENFAQETISPQLSQFVGRKFEKVCEDTIRILNRREELSFNASKVGRWWSGGEEIDIVAVGEEESLVAECKWTENPIGIKTLQNLRAKAEKVGVSGEKHYAMFSKSGFTEELLEENILCYDLERMKKIYRD